MVDDIIFERAQDDKGDGMEVKLVTKNTWKVNNTNFIDLKKTSSSTRQAVNTGQAETSIGGGIQC